MNSVRSVIQRKRFPLDIMLVCVRWYVAYPLSLRNLEEMMQERGVFIDHSTIHRWVIKLVPVLEEAFRKRKRKRGTGAVGKSWRQNHNAIVATEVLTLSRDYFRLRKGLERRLYELARKHCGLQAKFTIGLDTLLKKSGAMCSLKEFRRQIKEVVTSNALPDYSLEFDPAGDVVTIWTRDGGKRLRRMIAEVQERGIATLDGILT